jgi:hypothetical protein
VNGVAIRDPGDEQFLRLMALHKYFLNADFLRDVFMRRIDREQAPAETDAVTSIDDSIALSLWYATIYVVIEGCREAQLSDSELDALLADHKVDDLRRFRNQVFHFQREYDNPRLLEFLGTSDADAQAATEWIRRTHAALGRAIQKAVQGQLAGRAAANQPPPQP